MLKKKRIKSNQELIKLTDQEVVDLDVFKVPGVISKVLKQFPNYKVTAKIEVTGNEDIVIGDYITISVELDRLNVKEGEEKGFIHSNTYPLLRKDNFHIFITDTKDQHVMAYLKMHEDIKVQKSELRFPAEIQGVNKYNLHVINDSYCGFDETQPIEFQVLKNSDNREDFMYHQEDRHIEPSLMEQMMNGLKDTNSDEEVETDDEDEDDRPKKKGELKAASSDEEEEEDEGEEGEETKQ